MFKSDSTYSISTELVKARYSFSVIEMRLKALLSFKLSDFLYELENGTIKVVLTTEELKEVSPVLSSSYEALESLLQKKIELQSGKKLTCINHYTRIKYGSTVDVFVTREFANLHLAFNITRLLKGKNMGMEKLTYRGFVGSVEFSEADNVLFGKVQGINESISYEGTTIEELKKGFEYMIDGLMDDYEMEKLFPIDF